MTEEARAAALHEDYIAAAIRLMEVGSELRARGVHANDTPVTVEPWRFLEIVKSAKDAGVREGIRRSRAQLEVWKSDAPTTGHVYYSEAIRAIDALEAL